MKAKNLTPLLHMVEAEFAAEQAKLSQLTNAVDDIRRQINDLVKTKNREQKVYDSALEGVADVRWHHWIDTRKSALNLELARVLAKRTCQIDAVRLIFGKKEVLTALVKRAAFIERKNHERRTAHMS